jgi:peroxiredoxin
MKWLIMLTLMAGGAPSARAGEAWLGLALEKGARGARVTEVMEGSPAKKAGVRVGEEVVAIDETSTASRETLIAAVDHASVGHRARLKLVDGKGHARLLEVKLEPRPDQATLARAQLLGRAAPDFAPEVQTGEKLGKLSSLRGQVVLIDFFATWCAPCIDGMPHLEKLHQRLGPHGLKVIGISTEAPSVVASAAGRFHVSYTIAADSDEKVASRYHVFALPTAVLIDRKGVVRQVAIAETDSIDAAVEAAIKAH